MSRARLRALTVALALAALCSAQGAGGAPGDVVIHPSSWQVVAEKSGKVSYYSVVTDAGRTFVRARYRPPLKTVVLGWQASGSLKKAARRVRWEWRAQKLPPGGNDCVKGKGDSAAATYVTWKRGLKYYVLKYVWSGAGTKGRSCERKRNLFVAEDAVVVRAGPPLDVWESVDIDLRSEFRRHFADGDPDASVPDFVGMAIVTDGDQTRSESAADYGPFTISR